MAENSGDQSAVFSFLGDPVTHGLSEPVKRITTHGAAVFLAGGDAYKVKRAVHYPYMDFSTLEKRKAACENEIVINRENAPKLYLGVVAITKDAAGLHLGWPGEVVEWAVHLRRFDEDATLDLVVAHGGTLDPQLIASLAQRVEAMHRRAPVRDGAAGTRALRAALDETLGELRESSEFVAPALVEWLVEHMTHDFNRLEPLLLFRGNRGRVRRCHGDLHLRNIVLIDGEPVIFDALEFDDALATTDTLYDLGFLLMDLCEHGLIAEANQLLNHYLWCCEDEKGEIEGLALMPLFLALRALIRAKVTITQIRQTPQDAAERAQGQSAINSYLNAARSFLDPEPARVIAIGGLSGTGKTTLAAAIAPEIGTAPGAVHLRSDIERKRMFGVDPSTHLSREAYDASVSKRVYQTLSDYAATTLGVGRSVIVDATFRSAHEREAIATVAKEHPFTGIWLEAPRAVLLARVAARQRDASDATAPVVTVQLSEEPGQISWTRLDASQSIEKLKAAVLQLIARHHTS
ncbi:MAG: AAA family ATPase [Alphaproteobacteria bacterium]